MDAAHKIEERTVGSLADIRDLLTELVSLRAEVELLRANERRLLGVIVRQAVETGRLELRERRRKVLVVA